MAKTKVKTGVHNYTESEEYVVPQSKEVQEHIKWFMGLKLGFMMHWAPVTQLGVMESWPLCDGDADWSQVEVDWTDDIEEFKEQYWNLPKTFNPVKFRPDKWAELARECGFKYLLFTTKHHDGFCMYDSKVTDYKITSPDCPFSKNKYADVVDSMFNAFRNEGLAVSAYFSKPDWHSDYFWHREFGNAPTRNVNYDVKKYPELWEKFVEYTHAQMTELTSNYGKIDVLWLDGGWVRPDVDGQDIRLSEISAKIRSTTQPHLIVCDRTVSGENENIITPEQSIPSEPMDVPWETCMSLGHSFSFHFEDEYKTPRDLVCTFIDIVSKGGNLALNVAPRADGMIPSGAVHILRQFGGWLNKNGEGIYETEISQCRAEARKMYTHKGNNEYAFFTYGQVPVMPPYIVFKACGKVKNVTLLRTGENVEFTQNGEIINLKTATLGKMGMEYADCFRMTCE